VAFYRFGISQSAFLADVLDRTKDKTLELKAINFAESGFYNKSCIHAGKLKQNTTFWEQLS
jgi:hypothetical protein